MKGKTFQKWKKIPNLYYPFPPSFSDGDIMMKKAGFAILFFLILTVDLIALGNESWIELRYITKPAITISLLLYLWLSSLNWGRLKWGLTLGLLLFLIGNVILLFGDSQPYFISSLVAFLLAQLCYALAFFRKAYLHHTKFEPFLIGITLYLLLVLYIISASLQDLVIYVLIYMMVLMTFVLIAFIRMPFVSLKSGTRVLTGAFLFAATATIYSIDRFSFELALSEFFVFGAYGIGQYLLITGGIAEGNLEV